MRTPAAADLKRWSDEVARDPASLAFLPLARAYRRQGQREAAVRLCLRGLEKHPNNVDAHALLAILYLEAGERQKAVDEWGFVLSLDPSNFEAQRGMGFYYLELDDVELARRHLERAAAVRPDEPAVREAMAVIRQRLEEGSDTQPARARNHAAGGPAAPAGAATTAALARDPLRVFEPLLAESPFLGAVILDGQGLVTAGTLAGQGQADALGAVLGGAVDEASRAASLLALGDWRGILLETADAVLHLAPLSEGAIVLLAAKRDAPTGWVLRTAARAAEMGRRFLEESP